MSEETNKDGESKRFKFTQDEIIMPDLAEVWKELYYSTEKAWADAFKDFVTTETFVNMLDKTLEQYLAYEKMSRESIDKYCEMNPMASKKDIARVAELVVSLEDKLDDMEFQLFDNVKVIADNMLKIVNIQDSFRNGFDSLKSSVGSLEERILGLEGKLLGQSESKNQEIIDEVTALQNLHDDKHTSSMNQISSQLDALGHSLKHLSMPDLEKSLKKIESLEKKIDALSKDVKATRKRAGEESKGHSKSESPLEPE